jgi:DNA polymerase-3 subunit delta
MSTIPVFQVYEKILADIQKRAFEPVYLLQGKEPFFIDKITEALEATVLQEHEKSFNQTILYGKETNTMNLLMAARRYPMGATHQLIVVKEAQHLQDLDKLEAYLEAPQPSTILVLCIKSEKKLDKRTKLAKLFGKYCIFDSDPLKDFQMKRWLDNWTRTQGKTLDALAAEMVTDYLGTDLSLVVNELSKLFINVKDAYISAKHIQEHIGLSKEFNVFELQKALGARNFNKSIQIAHHLSSDMSGRNHGTVLIGALVQYFNKVLLTHGHKSKDKDALAKILEVHPFFVQEYLAAAGKYSPAAIEKVLGYLKYFDLRFKGVNKGGASDNQLFVELIVNILKN